MNASKIEEILNILKMWPGQKTDFAHTFFSLQLKDMKLVFIKIFNTTAKIHKKTVIVPEAQISLHEDRKFYSF